jgi:hypothetical protein
MAKKVKEPVLVGHRDWGVFDDHADWCRKVVNFEDRQDSVPCLNGVAVGQWWRNLHTKRVGQVREIRLAGLGTHTAHYESIILLYEDDDEDGIDRFGLGGEALWSICEHRELVEKVEDGWQRVEPQPPVWEGQRPTDFALAKQARVNGTPYRDEDAWVCRVRHDRPEGDTVVWKGERGTVWTHYKNGVLLCDGIVMSSFSGFFHMDRERLYDMMIDRYPLAAPGPFGKKGGTAISLDQLAEAMKQMTPEQVEQLEIALAAA